MTAPAKCEFCFPAGWSSDLDQTVNRECPEHGDAPERTEAEMAERIAAFEAAPPAPESLKERIATALWEADEQFVGYKGMAEAVIDIVSGSELPGESR